MRTQLHHARGREIDRLQYEKILLNKNKITVRKILPEATCERIH